MSNTMYSSTQTCELVGITYRQLDYWARTDLFVPTEKANGSGSRRQYSFNDLVNLRIIKNMLDSGMKLHQVRKVVNYLADLKENITSADLVMTNDQIFLHDPTNPQALYDLIHQGQGVFTIVALSQAVNEINSQIISLMPKAKENPKLYIA